MCFVVCFILFHFIFYFYFFFFHTYFSLHIYNLFHNSDICICIMGASNIQTSLFINHSNTKFIFEGELPTHYHAHVAVVFCYFFINIFCCCCCIMRVCVFKYIFICSFLTVWCLVMVFLPATGWWFVFQIFNFFYCFYPMGLRSL